MPYRTNKSGEIEILIITARTNRHSWIFPVGHLDPNESLQGAAARECAEESGYEVIPGRGTYND